jgi:hypothetical protein
VLASTAKITERITVARLTNFYFFLAKSGDDGVLPFFSRSLEDDATQDTSSPGLAEELIFILVASRDCV